MAKYAIDAIMDYGLNFLGTAATMMYIGTNAPASFANATAFAIGTLATTSTDWTLGDDTSGRKTTHAAATIAVGTTGTLTDIYFTNAATLLFNGTCAPTAVTSGGTVIVAAWDVDSIADVT